MLGFRVITLPLSDIPMCVKAKVLSAKGEDDAGVSLQTLQRLHVSHGFAEVSLSPFCRTCDAVRVLLL